MVYLTATLTAVLRSNKKRQLKYPRTLTGCQTHSSILLLFFYVYTEFEVKTIHQPNQHTLGIKLFPNNIFATVKHLGHLNLISYGFLLFVYHFCSQRHESKLRAEKTFSFV